MKNIRAVIIVVFAICQVNADRFFVLPTAAAGGDGRTWASAYQELQSALESARPGDSVWVAKGSYTPSKDTAGTAVPADPRTLTFAVKTGVHLYGGFSGDESVISGRNPVLNRTVLSGDLGITDSTSDNAYHVVTGAPGSVLDGFTVSFGNANATGENAQSGAVYRCDGMVIANCSITGNSAVFGGAISLFGVAPLQVINSTFTGNRASNIGAAVNITSSTVEVTFHNTVFKHNEPGSGSSIYNSGASPVFTNCIFDSNCTPAVSYGLYSEGGRPRLINCVVYSDHLYGKTIDSSSIVVTNSIMWGTASITGPASVSYSCLCFMCSGTGNFNADPLFVDFQTGDFRLKPGSPCVDKADGSQAPPFDFDGNPRYDYPNVENNDAVFADIGAFECTTPNIPPVITGAHVSGGYVDETITIALDSLSVEDGDNSYPEDFTLIIGTGSFGRVTTTRTYIVIKPLSTAGTELSIPVRVRDLIDTSAEYIIKVEVKRRVAYVDASATGLNNGSSWKNAYPNLFLALQTAPSTSEIWVAKGTYLPVLSDTATARTNTFAIVSASAPLYGGFAGVETERTQRNWRMNETILSGDIGRPGDSMDNCFHVVTATAKKIIDGFVITGGNADSLDGSSAGMYPKFPYSYGGGLHATNTAPEVVNCTFRRNRAWGGGAVYYYSTGTTPITNCIFCYNSAIDTAPGKLTDRRGGGAIFTDRSSNPVITSCVFYRNSVTANGWGAAAYHYWSGILKFVNCTFFNNSDATNSRTGLAVEWATRADVTNSIIINTSVGNLDNRGPTVFSYSCFPPGTVQAGTGNIFVAPKFVDTAANDFHLSSGSLCIDQASAAFAPAFDIEGKARWDHPGFDNIDSLFADIGAYEYRPVATDARPEARRKAVKQEWGLEISATSVGSSIRIAYSLPVWAGMHNVRFSLFDARGVRVAYHEVRTEAAGSHSIVISPSKTMLAGQGLYFCRMETGKVAMVRKLFVVR